MAVTGVVAGAAVVVCPGKAHYRPAASQRSADVVVVFLTARALVNELGEGVAAGADGVLSKPFDPMTVGRELGAILDEARAERTVVDG